MTDGADPSARRPGAATGKTATGKLIRWSDSLNISPRARRRWVVTYALGRTRGHGGRYI